MKTVEWFKKYQYWIIAIIATAIIVFAIIQEVRLVRLQNKYSALGVKYFIIQKERDGYKEDIWKLKKSYDSLQTAKETIRIKLLKKQNELFWLQAKHKKEIDSLLNKTVPIDSIYSRTKFIFPNYDNGLLEYPYSGSQVRHIYTYGIEYPRLLEEHTLQTGVYNTCLELNNKYKLSESNLSAQILNLNNDVSAANKQLDIQYNQITSLNKQAKIKNIWNYVFKGTTVIALIFAVAK